MADTRIGLGKLEFVLERRYQNKLFLKMIITPSVLDGVRFYRVTLPM